MMTLTTELPLQSSSDSTRSAEARRALWRYYEDWVRKASDQELQQLHAALDAFHTADVQSLVNVICQASVDEVAKQQFPTSFLAPLHEPNWLDAAVPC